MDENTKDVNKEEQGVESTPAVETGAEATTEEAAETDKEEGTSAE
jgi:hypothetical protein